jgi:hypothetical protein
VAISLGILRKERRRRRSKYIIARKEILICQTKMIIFKFF